jgi:hypothetical protein
VLEIGMVWMPFLILAGVVAHPVVFVHWLAERGGY